MKLLTPAGKHLFCLDDLLGGILRGVFQQDVDAAVQPFAVRVAAHFYGLVVVGFADPGEDLRRQFPG